MSLAFSIATIVLISEFVLWFGYSSLASLVYTIYLNTFQKEILIKQRKIKKEILNVKHDLARTSSQDQFAKWAKLRRKLDSKLSELEKLTTSLGFLKTTFEIKCTTFLWAIINGSQTLMVLWYFSTPVFYLPDKWFSPVTFTLSLPFAPSGSVSVLVWFLVCRKVLKRVIITFPIYHKYVPDIVKKNVTEFFHWCNNKLGINLPFVVEESGPRISGLVLEQLLS
ncbi:926_t:CDS:2 [Diversispora eburnea]|uniref:926_t:CDS:1 n=1 Tax=Diversispora eburnea TaxID=1213867 RepID=A0A9N8WD55_9GLOM|nr:926_t:CDS:2 [Diversispora eburnea]